MADAAAKLPLEKGLAAPSPDRPDGEILAQEVKLGCTLGMLLCLDRDQRLAYVLSDVFELSSDEGAYVCDITAPAFRQRAARGRAKLRASCRALRPGEPGGGVSL
ncbi:MAG: hypothetical protein M3133_04000 [Actinomycetota bacterium]|nr:hypothetical protein [Actinomycetota bacterium]